MKEIQRVVQKLSGQQKSAASVIVVQHYDGNGLSFNPGLQYPHLHGTVHTPDNNRWDTPPV